MSKKYKLDRKVFLLYYQDTPFFLLMIKKKIIVNDMILGGEFVITAQDVLDSMETIPGALVGVQGKVLSSDCELIYTQ